MDHDYATMKPQITGDVEERGAMEALDVELELFEKDLAALEVKFGPILHQYDTARMSEPKPELSSQLRGRIERIAVLRNALAQIHARVDL